MSAPTEVADQQTTGAQNTPPQRGDVKPHPAADQQPPPSAPDIRRPDDAEPREGRELIEAAARAGKGRDKLSSDEQIEALEWFLADEDTGEPEDDTYTFQMNVGTPTRKRWVTWTIQSVDLDELKRIRRQSQQKSRRTRITGQSEVDNDKANIQIVLRGTVVPDLRAAARQMGLVDPADAVRQRFQKKPGLIDQIAGEVMSLSGYDDEDIREVDAARG